MKNNFCINCKRKISKYATRCIICRNKYIAENFIKNKKRSIQFKLKISKFMKQLLKNPQNHPNWRGGISLNKKCIDCEKKLNNYKSKRCKKCYNHYMKSIFKNNKNPMYIDGRTLKKHRCKNCSKKISYTSYLNSKICKKCYQKNLIGINNPNYKHGLSKFPYPLSFSEKLKEQIRKRDNYKCKYCNKTQKQELKKNRRKLAIHHIDYNKFNNNITNLIVLCQNCNEHANTDRNYWYAYFRYIIENDYKNI